MADVELNSIGNGDGTNYLVRDNTKIPLSGSSQISGSLISATDNSIDIGSSTKNLKMLYTKGITIDGTQFLPSDYIPRSGGAVITGTNFFRTTTDSSLHIGGGTSKTNGGSIQLYGDDGYYPGDVIIRATKPNEDICVYMLTNGAFYPLTSVALGSSYYKWGQIYSTNSTISTSDERQKDNIKQIDDKLLQAWENVNTVQFNFKDALEKKGENARLHTGYIAQNIQQACEEKGVNPNDYGLFCFDSWEEQEEKKDKNGEVIEPYRAKGDLYSLRYEEALVVECAYLRKKNKDLQEQLNALSERLEKLENR